ncbi:hypothetical protein, partial [Enterobacter cloacae complex sp. 4DZ3-17B2]|uniref:hypothetical protein n=1 Tax=Enterobacter cloacae complex sp. 4DZ3-17B2 TaxID=2511990 RepID=UPI001CA5EF68
MPMHAYYEDPNENAANPVYYPPKEPLTPKPWSMIGNTGPRTAAQAAGEGRYSLDERTLLFIANGGMGG